jgi:hypothetical protein
MARALLIVTAFTLLAGCEHFAPSPYVGAIEPGMSTAQVAGLLGVPSSRRVGGTGEQWAYCMNGWLTDDFVVVEFDELVRVASSGSSLDTEFGHCTEQLRAFNEAN